ncbi:unnamed protein product [Paramecium pentaurelia]|uniref:Uncharacterized protein n=1 Tax=Paramecium pentaurelia TaxID=43138 RepID=A0A8S1YMJ6_9CILI|nr:unnamed protein product [Paramecium pentaurelia]
MGLSFLVFLLAKYYFVIIEDLFFWNQYQDQSFKLWLSFLQIFDFTLKIQELLMIIQQIHNYKFHLDHNYLFIIHQLLTIRQIYLQFCF